MSVESQDLQDLTEEVMTLQELNANLAHRLEMKGNEIREMSDFISELSSENKEKSNAIGKASKIIESLRDELEKAKDDIKILELDKQKLVHENKLAERELIETQKENFNYENLKKAETRAKDKTQKLKGEISSVTQEFEKREQNFLSKIQELQLENRRLEARLVQNDEEVVRIKEQYTRKDQEFLNAVDKLVKADEECQRLADEIKGLKTEREEADNNYSKELRLVKKEAENNIRYYKNLSKQTPLTVDTLSKENDFHMPESQLQPNDHNNWIGSNEISALYETNRPLSRVPSQNQLDESAISQRTSFRKSFNKPASGVKKRVESTKLKRNTSNKTLRAERVGSDYGYDAEVYDEQEKGRAIASKISSDFYKVTLAESIERENSLIQYIEKNLNKEAEAVNKLSETVFEKEVTLRPEIERWMMRNEELEQKLRDYVQRIRILEIMLGDCHKALEISGLQRNTEKQMSDQMIKELESIVNFLHVEIEDKNKVILALFPECEGYLEENTAHSQSKFNSLHMQYQSVDEDLTRIRNEKKNLLYHFEDLKKEHNELIDHYFQLRTNLTDLGKLLGFDFNEPGDASESEMYDISAQYGTIVQKINDLLDMEREYAMYQQDTDEEQARLRGDISKLQEAINELINEKNMSQKDKMEMQDELSNLNNILKELNMRLEESKRRITILEKEKVNLTDRVIDGNKENGSLKSILHEREEAIQQLNLEMSALKEELQQKTTKIEDLTSQYDETLKEKQQVTDQLATVNNDYLQTFDLLEKALKDFESAQQNVERYANIIREKEEEIEDVKGQAIELEDRLEETEMLLHEKEQELNAAGITIEHKNSVVNMLEEKFKETKKNEEALKLELTKTKIEMINDGPRSDLANNQKQTSAYKERLSTKESGDFRNTQKNTNMAERDNNMETFDNRMRSLPSQGSHQYQNRIQEYEVLLDYIQTSLRNICDDDFKFDQNSLVHKERPLENFFQNTPQADLFTNIKRALKTIIQKFKDVLNTDIKFTTRITQVILDHIWTLSSQEQIMLEDQCSYIVQNSFENIKDTRQVTSTLKEQVLNILTKENIWSQRSSNVQITGLSDRRMSYRYSPELSPSTALFKISEYITALTTANIEKATLMKPILEKLSRVRGYENQSNWGMKDVHDFGAQTLVKDIVEALEQLLSSMQQTSSIEAKVLSEINSDVKAVQQNSDIGEANLSRKIADIGKSNMEGFNKCHEKMIKFVRDYQDFIKRSADPEKLSVSSTLKTLTDTKRELKDHSFQLLKEFFSEIEFVIKILYKYCGKLDSKSKSRHHKISSLTEDPASIFKALEESLGKNTSDFIDNLKKEFGEYINSEEESPEENHEFLQKIFNFRMKLFNADKLEDETSNFKNVFKLLDISHLLQEVNKDESQYILKYDEIRTRSHDVNKIIEKVIDMLPSVMLRSWDTVGFDRKALNVIDDPQKLYDKLRSTYSDPYDTVKKGGAAKSHMRYQIMELLRENGGNRIGMNYLLYVFYKFKIIINDLSKEDA